MRTMSEKKDRKWTRVSKGRGFTLAETLMVVAILTVLMAVAFVGVIRWRKTLKQLEYDGTAKEIFVAAQNHLALAESQGLLEETIKVGGTAQPAFSRGTRIGTTDEYYFVYGTGTDDPSDKGSVLYLMLPFGSIDEMVRAGGSYIIHYQPDAAVVLDVFYTEDTRKGKLSSDDYNSLMGIKDNKSERLNYGSNKMIVGYYGGGTKGQTPIKLQAPTVQVENADKLKMTVTYPEKNFQRLSDSKTNLTLIIEEVSFDKSDNTFSGAKRSINLKNLTYSTVGDNRVYEGEDLVLDDVTQAGGSIAKRNGWVGTFTPGRNIKMYVEAQSNGSGGSTEIAIARSAEVETNSLFAQTASVTTEGGNQVLNVEISSYRHLANLSYAVSGFEGAGCTIINATQTTDLLWDSFKSNTGGDTTSIYSYSGGTATASQAGAFSPVDVSSGLVLIYDGLKQSAIVGATPTAHKVTGVAVNAAGPAGIFAKLATSGSQIKNLEVVNASVTSSGNAGALVGEMAAETEVSNVLVRTTLRSGDINDHTITANGTGNAGGLVGLVNGGTVSACAAAVYVQSASGAAGGLVGSATGAATITQSYSGGHTSGDAAGAITYPDDSFDVSSTSGPAGGLVGSFAGASGAKIEACYSTCSAGGGSAAGGLVGSSSGATIKNCYVTGLVLGGEATTGAFVGSLTGSEPATSNFYYQMVNGSDVKAIGGSTEDTNVTPFDKNAYEDTDLSAFSGFFVTNNANSKAVPYNVGLGTLYKLDGKVIYPFKTIEGLGGLTEDMNAYQQHLTHHYGDWPSYEVLIINK